MQRAWRRLHAPDIIAQVEAIPGFGTWEVSIWRSTSPTEVERSNRRFALLTEAQEAADQLVSSTFGHLCQVGQCGHWLLRSG
jgi:hypothetical protein